MPVEICTVSGYSEFGRNMTAVKYKDDVVLIDMGIQPEKYIRISEDADELEKLDTAQLVKAGAIPNTKVIKDWKSKVRAIVPGHAHLDHCGAIVYLAGQFDAPILATPFTAEVLKTMIADKEMVFRNKIIAMQPDSSKKITDNVTIELINATHSTPQSSMVAIHTPEGVILYAADFKFDDTPTLGKPTNYKRLKELANENVLALIVEATYGSKPGRTPSEAVAKDMLRQAVDAADTKNNAIIVTTFSSHLARLKSALEIAQKHKRKVVFLGRSMGKYVAAGENAGIIDFKDKCELVKYGSKVDRKLKEIDSIGKEKVLIICSGHQGEPRSVLSRIITKQFLDPKDFVIFSCKTIPTPTNIANRQRLERELKRMGVNILTDVHQSGHAAQDELLDLISMVKPKNIIPSHGDASAKVELV